MAGNKKNPRKSSGTRKKMLTVTPITIRQNYDEDMRIRMKPLQGLAAFRDNRGNVDHWCIMLYRLVLGLDLLQSHFNEQQYVQTLAYAISAVCSIQERYIDSVPQCWEATTRETDIIGLGLNIVDELHQLSSRRDLLASFLKVDVMMANFNKCLLLRLTVFGEFFKTDSIEYKQFTTNRGRDAGNSYLAYNGL